MAADNAVHIVDVDGDTLRVAFLDKGVVFTTIAKGQHVDDGLGVLVTREALADLNKRLIEFEGE